MRNFRLRNRLGTKCASGLQASLSSIKRSRRSDWPVDTRVRLGHTGRRRGQAGAVTRKLEAGAVTRQLELRDSESLGVLLPEEPE